MTPLERRILDISYKHRLSHIGSCLTAVAIIDDIYSKKKPEDKFVLSCGHAGLALYVVLEKYAGFNAEALLALHGVHPNRDGNGIHCSTGSLGQGICIALGMALADRSKNVYCLLSDGECAEGSVYEALNARRKYNISNLIVYCNYNGFGAYDTISRISVYGIKIVETLDHWFMKRYGQESHYKTLNEQEYETIRLSMEEEINP